MMRKVPLLRYFWPCKCARLVFLFVMGNNLNVEQAHQI